MSYLELMRLERRLETLLAPFSGMPGATIGVFRDGEKIAHVSNGLASLELGVPIGPATRFRIASVSKQFTCAAVLRLAHEGRLSLDDEARVHLPELPDYGARLTVADLLHNSAGIRDMLQLMALGGADLAQPVRRPALLDAIFRQSALNFAPNTGYLYSNSNFLLAGVIVERVSGWTLSDYLHRHFFAPLGMTRTEMSERTDAPLPGLATGYLPDAEGWRRAQHGFAIGGEGGLVSCVEDLALWERHLATAGATLATELATQRRFDNGFENFYARGQQVRRWRGVLAVDHGGLWPGYKTHFLRLPEYRLCVVAMANNGRADPLGMAYDAAAAVLGDALTAQPALPDVSPFVGRWFDPDEPQSVDFEIADGVLSGRAGGVPFAVEATTDGRIAARHGSFLFACRREGDLLHVEQDAGRVSYWHRAPSAAPIPDGLDGTYVSSDLAATWRVAGDQVRVAGPVVRTQEPWSLSGLAGDIFRIEVPGALYRTVLDVRAQRQGTHVRRLCVHAGRVRGIVMEKP
ncbi:MAG: serine hydrolase [Rhodospirillales bacterium]|nr:serine hydrolase [Rhodospirillales bacterium]